MKKKIPIIIGILLIIFLFFIWWGTIPKHGKIKTEIDERAVVTKIEQKYLNNYFSFVYDDDYEVRNEGNNLWLTGKSGVWDSITVMCREFKDSLDEEAGVKLRRIKKDEYNEKTINVYGSKGLFFEKKDLSERTVFILKDGIMITISMTANSNDKSIEEKFQKIIDSWCWKT